MTSVLTWYDVLGVLPDATPEDIREACLARNVTLRQATLPGTAPDVLSAAQRALHSVQEAGRVLADPVARESYDQDIGIFRSGEGLTPPSRGPSGPDVGLGEGWSQANEEALEPYSDPRARVAVPDVRGLFFQACMHVTGRIGLHVTPIQLTPHPLPVEGLVVGQAPAPGERVHRDSPLTVRVWHPSASGDQQAATGGSGGR